MWSVKKTETYRQQSLMWNDRQICIIKAWDFQCCGVAQLCSFGTYGKLPEPHPWDFLSTLTLEVYTPGEFQFLLTTAQILGNLESWLRDDRVSLRDKFSNKAHGPYDLFLYRFSAKRDFRLKKDIR